MTNSINNRLFKPGETFKLGVGLNCDKQHFLNLYNFRKNFFTEEDLYVLRRYY